MLLTALADWELLFPIRNEGPSCGTRKKQSIEGRFGAWEKVNLCDFGLAETVVGDDVAELVH
jgi:hypothetical protein